MSILAEILQSVEVVDVEFINKKVPELKQNVESFKGELITTVENVYVKYSNRSKTNDVLLNKVLQAQSNLRVLKEKADYVSNKDLMRTNAELSKNVDELEGIEFTLKVVENVQNILNLIHRFDTELGLASYATCVDILKKLEDTIQSIPTDECLDGIGELKQTICEKKIGFQNVSKNIFSDNIEIKENRDKIVTLKIKQQNEVIKNILVALYKYTEQIGPLHNLTRDLWELILVPLVDSDVTLTENEDASYATLNLVVDNPDKKSHYKKVFENLKRVLNFLQKYFNYSISENLTALVYIGNDISHNLSELIIKNCLRDTIPSTAEELQNYKVVIEDTKELEKALLESNIFNEETASILEYASNVDILFINKKCEGYILQATAIMKKDLHDMIEIGVPFDPDYPLGREIQDFPQCSISKNVVELLKLCEKILQEALQASPECSGRLFTTVSNIIAKYAVFVSAFHKYHLTTLPQQIALFYNNCRYISHTLEKWNMEFCTKLVHVLVTCDFNSEATQLPVIALDIFSTYMEGQIKQIDEIMSGAQLDGPTIEKLDPKTEKCVRQCLRQQELLRTVWHKVLSYNMYNNNIGTIVDTLCKNLIDSIVKFQDLPARVAEQLVDVIKLILTRAPKLFTDQKEITLFVPLWYKLNELSFVLNGSLVEINDRWADGKGPLALQFQASEMKQLIKSLFQNTDRRAAVLARITDTKIKS